MFKWSLSVISLKHIYDFCYGHICFKDMSDSALGPSGESWKGEIISEWWCYAFSTWSRPTFARATRCYVCIYLITLFKRSSWRSVTVNTARPACLPAWLSHRSRAAGYLPTMEWVILLCFYLACLLFPDLPNSHAQEAKRKPRHRSLFRDFFLSAFFVNRISQCSVIHFAQQISLSESSGYSVSLIKDMIVLKVLMARWVSHLVVQPLPVLVEGKHAHCKAENPSPAAMETNRKWWCETWTVRGSREEISAEFATVVEHVPEHLIYLIPKHSWNYAHARTQAHTRTLRQMCGCDDQWSSLSKN